MPEIDLDWRSLLLEDTSSQPFPSARAFVQQEFAEANAELLATAGPSGANVSEVARSIARRFDALALSLVVRVTDATSAASCVRELDSLLNWWLEHYGRVFQPMHPDVGFAVQELQAITRIRLTERTLRRKTDAWRYATEPKDPRVVSSDEVGAEQRLRAEALARVAPDGISGAEQTGATGLSGGSSARADAGPAAKSEIPTDTAEKAELIELMQLIEDWRMSAGNDGGKLTQEAVATKMGLPPRAYVAAKSGAPRGKDHLGRIRKFAKDLGLI